MLSSLALSLLLAPAPFQLPRVYQPVPKDPSSHGGAPGKVQAGDLTVDGRLAILSVTYPISPTLSEERLVAVTVDPSKIQVDANGNLDKFLDEVSPTSQWFTVVDGQGQVSNFQKNDMYGDEFTFSPLSEAYVIEIPPNAASTAPPPNDPNGQVLPLPSGVRGLAVTLRDLDENGPTFGENPYPCDANGNFQLDGSHKCYELWMVDLDYTWSWNGTAWTFSTSQDEVRLGGRELQVIVDESLARPRVVSATLGTFEELSIGPAGNPILGIEPTITADGQLILYHSDGGINKVAGTAVPYNPWGRTTYIWNPTPHVATGWTAPRSVTDMYTAEANTEVGTLEDGTKILFPERYGLARHPILEPDGTSPGSTIRGPYPWVDRDGGFYSAMYTYTEEANLVGPQPQPVGTPECQNDPCSTSSPPCPGVATRAGYYVVGDITQGYMKHVDETALNPTRAGGAMDWPVGQGVRNSNRLFTPSTGLRPSLWEPFIGEDVPVPSQEASTRIPVLPVFSINLDMYGEVRFEEADGNYLLYLAGNEGFMQSTCQPSQKQPDPSSTPDTSGRVPRADCVLRDGAAFPQEVYGGNQAVRESIGTPTSPGHECVGFKGQALLFPTTGHVEVTINDAVGPTSEELTVQAFVKVLDDGSGTMPAMTLVEDPGRYELGIDANGFFVARVWVNVPGFENPVEATVTSSIPAPPMEPDPFDPTAGWRHVAMVYDGDFGGGSLLGFYVDGQFDPSFSFNAGILTTIDLGSSIEIGPNDAVHGTSTPVRLLLDEIAISDVLRTEAEIRRDAYVAPEDDGFGAWPAEIPLPLGLDASEAKLPDGVTYSTAKEDLGRDLFDAVILSGTGTTAPTWGATSCATCHEPGNDFAEALPLAQQFGGGSLPFNTPTVLNSAFGTHKFFDGRAADLEAQAIEPIESPTEMNLPVAEALARLNDLDNKDPQGIPWRERFQQAYSGPATQDNLAEVLALYQRTLNSGDSDFDKDLAFREGLAGGADVLTPAEKRGRALFFGKARCFGCHRGSSFSDDDFHNVLSVFDDGLGTILGRGGFTGRASEEGMLKVPTLRNIGGTEPYFHDAQAATLDDVIDHYDRGGGRADGQLELGALDRQILPLILTSAEKDDLKAFLLALSGTSPQ